MSQTKAGKRARKRGKAKTKGATGGIGHTPKRRKREGEAPERHVRRLERPAARPMSRADEKRMEAIGDLLERKDRMMETIRGVEAQSRALAALAAELPKGARIRELWDAVDGSRLGAKV